MVCTFAAMSQSPREMGNVFDARSWEHHNKKLRLWHVVMDGGCVRLRGFWQGCSSRMMTGWWLMLESITEPRIGINTGVCNIYNYRRVYVYFGTSDRPKNIGVTA